MTKTAFTGPLITFGDRNPIGSGVTGSVNSDKAPNLFWGGNGILDPRVGYNVTRAGSIGWGCGNGIPVIDQVPAALAATNVCSSSTVTNGAMTLAAASTGITVLSAGLQVWSSGNTVPANSLVLDGNPGLITFGYGPSYTSFSTVSLYDPTTLVARALRVVSGGGGDSGTVLISGYDIYGYPMSESITISASSTATGKKAFKFVTSAVVTGTITSGTVGTTDIIGFPLRVDSFLYQNTVWIASAGGVAAATAQTTPFGTASAFTYEVTTTSTTTTGDVRGTLNLGTAQASDGSKVLQIEIVTSVANIGSTAGLVGVTQA